MKISESTLKDLATWMVVLVGAEVTAMQSVDFSQAHGQMAAAATGLGILATALKTFPTFGLGATKLAPEPTSVAVAAVVSTPVPPVPAP